MKALDGCIPWLFVLLHSLLAHGHCRKAYFLWRQLANLLLARCQARARFAQIVGFKMTNHGGHPFCAAALKLCNKHFPRAEEVFLFTRITGGIQYDLLYFEYFTPPYVLNISPMTPPIILNP